MRKWNDHDMLTFLDLYQKHECLWNTKLDSYKIQKHRDIAITEIISAFGHPDLTPLDVKSKIKNIRTTYGRELRKILVSKKNGSENGNVYKPELVWFEKADSFLREVTEARRGTSNVVIRIKAQATPPEEVSDGQNPEAYEEVSHNPQPSFLVTESFSYEDAGSSPAKVNKRSDTTSVVDAIKSLGTVTKETTEDEFETFGKHVANQLRRIPIARAMICQQEIQNILTRERISALQ